MISLKDLSMLVTLLNTIMIEVSESCIQGSDMPDHVIFESISFAIPY